VVLLDALRRGDHLGRSSKATPAVRRDLTAGRQGSRRIPRSSQASEERTGAESWVRASRVLPGRRCSSHGSG
jgi:hypothetical protein